MIGAAQRAAPLGTGMKTLTTGFASRFAVARSSGSPLRLRLLQPIARRRLAAVRALLRAKTALDQNLLRHCSTRTQRRCSLPVACSGKAAARHVSSAKPGSSLPPGERSSAPGFRALPPSKVSVISDSGLPCSVVVEVISRNSRRRLSPQSIPSEPRPNSLAQHDKIRTTWAVTLAIRSMIAGRIVSDCSGNHPIQLSRGICSLNAPHIRARFGHERNPPHAAPLNGVWRQTGFAFATSGHRKASSRLGAPGRGGEVRSEMARAQRPARRLRRRSASRMRRRDKSDSMRCSLGGQYRQCNGVCKPLSAPWDAHPVQRPQMLKVVASMQTRPARENAGALPRQMLALAAFPK